MHMFSAAGASTILFFALVSFFLRRERLSTNLGHATAALIALFYPPG